MRALLVVNPQATATSAAGRDVIAHALAADVKLDVVETSYRGHAADAAAQAMGDGFDLVVAHGGDGTVNEVVNGLLSEGVRDDVPVLGVVPGGSANVFARALGLPVDPVEATHRLLQAIETGARRRVGLGRADDRWFTFNAGMGWDADVVAGVERHRVKKATPMLYARMAATSYLQLDHRHPKLTVQVSGEDPEPGMHLAFVSNTDPWTYLGERPLRINPKSSFEDGLGVFALRSVGVPTVVKHAWQILRPGGDPQGGNLLRRDDVEWIRVTCAEPVRLQVDGDLLGERTDVRFMSVPTALTVAV
ncbi:diacylglycerol kinase family enzyme [Crossiella equi]|uniref:Diacylglycerol kinase family enzyme n=1 Tax=Crossiella equi TaxID=130796 RepID=A0ABS5AD88_9PSEU|nr:diacylglycerol kinase family protein [Crossiella equi]MBP2474540.1 diacylglycerol kinase family enzyme [Crossiella equi]